MSELEELFSRYEKVVSGLEYRDGELYWLTSQRTDLIGTLAGRVDRLGYRHIECSRKCYAVHRLIFFMHHGIIPLVIDHIDGNNSNNRIENLRSATVSKNMMNSKMFINNTSGVTGVSFHKQAHKWVAYIRLGGVQTSLGLHDTLFEAACSRKSAENREYGEFSRATSRSNIDRATAVVDEIMRKADAYAKSRSSEDYVLLRESVSSLLHP